VLLDKGDAARQLEEVDQVGQRARGARLRGHPHRARVAAVAEHGHGRRSHLCFWRARKCI
jgi:hypothetical protein